MIFVAVGVTVSLLREPELLQNLDWLFALLVLLCGVPVTITLNAYEFLLSGRLVGRGIPFVRALEIAIVGTAANMLPLPGATLVRIVGLKAAGAGSGDSVQATLFVASIWFGIAFLIAGLWMPPLEVPWLREGFLAFGAAASIASLYWARRLAGGLSVPVQVGFVKLLLVLTDVVRMLVCLRALGVDSTLAQNAAFAVTSVVGNVASVVPAGLGVREGLSAALAPLVGITASAGFVAASLNRLLGMVVILPLSAFLAAGLQPGCKAKDQAA
ncbi:MAG: hypothetical protein MI785_11365 [Kiloniellales bacterium]|nr:hypothetical protein [Kiloniellales bacterium]